MIAPKSPVVLHIPHASRLIPDDVRRGIFLSDEQLNFELLRMTDAFTDELFDLGPDLPRVICPVSRLCVDVERFADDSLEPMSARGMGVVYNRTSTGGELRHIDAGERQQLLDRYYLPHHRNLTNAVEATLQTWGHAIVIDCHSFASRPLPHEFDQNPDRPDICIGTDDFHTPQTLCQGLLDALEQASFKTYTNRPFSGALVPAPFYRTHPEVHSIMVEVNRKTYADEHSGVRLPEFSALKKRLQPIVAKLANGRLR